VKKCARPTVAEVAGDALIFNVRPRTIAGAPAVTTGKVVGELTRAMTETICETRPQQG
jgi:hypothetical protein